MVTGQAEAITTCIQKQDAPDQFSANTSCGDKSADTTTLSVRTISLAKEVARNTYISTVDVAVAPGLRNNSNIHAAHFSEMIRKVIKLYRPTELLL